MSRLKRGRRPKNSTQMNTDEINVAETASNASLVVEPPEAFVCLEITLDDNQLNDTQEESAKESSDPLVVLQVKARQDVGRGDVVPPKRRRGRPKKVKRYRPGRPRKIVATENNN